MDCERFQKDMSLLVDGELSPDASAVLLGHISACPKCRATHKAMTALNNRLRAVAPQADARMASRVKGSIAARRAITKGQRALPAWSQAPLLAAIVIIALGLGNLAGSSISDIIQGESTEATLEMFLPDSNRSLADVVVDLAAEDQ